MTYVSSGDVRVLPMYALYPRTYSIHVRMLSTYVCYRRTYPGLRVGDRDSGLRSRTRGFGTTRSEIEDSGLRDFGTTQSKSWIRDNADSEYAEHSGFWIWLKKIAVDLLGLRLVLKITMTLVIYLSDVQ